MKFPWEEKERSFPCVPDGGKKGRLSCEEEVKGSYVKVG